jgi:molybdopterin synthase sulfur carrier subunit
MKFKVKYFASLREKANKNEEEFSEFFLNSKDLYLFLTEKYNFPLGIDEIKVAINGEYHDFQKEIASGDVIAFIPPVAGG